MAPCGAGATTNTGRWAMVPSRMYWRRWKSSGGRPLATTQRTSRRRLAPAPGSDSVRRMQNDKSAAGGRLIYEHKRSHRCGDLREEHIGSDVVLMGWVQARRDHGGCIFIDLRDRAGVTQVVFDAEVDASVLEHATALRAEWVIGVRGKVRSRGATSTSRSRRAQSRSWPRPSRSSRGPSRRLLPSATTSIRRRRRACAIAFSICAGRCCSAIS